MDELKNAFYKLVCNDDEDTTRKRNKQMNFDNGKIEYIRKIRSDLKPQTITGYINSLKKMYYLYDTLTPFNDIIWVLDLTPLFKIIKSCPNFGVRNSYLSSLIFIYSVFYPEHNENIRFIKNEIIINREYIINEADEQKMTEKQKKNYVLYSQVYNCFMLYYNANNRLLNIDILTMDEEQKIQKLLILSLFILQPPRRPSAISEMFMIPEKIYNNHFTFNNENNYYVHSNNPFFIYNKYKTSGTYGKQKININNPLLITILKRYYEKYYKSDVINYLIPYLKNTSLPLSTDALKQKIKGTLYELTEKKINPSLLRVIYITHFTPKMTLKKRKELAYAMAHSHTTAEQWYKKKGVLYDVEF